jgi:uncharacterized DUF497 family protein
MPLRFEWDRTKARANEVKHGMSFEEARTAFGDPCSLTIHDSRSPIEDRYVLIGMTDRGRLVVVVHVERGDNLRLISARRPTRHERATYEESRREEI